jgi:hypothetical protein
MPYRLLKLAEDHAKSGILLIITRDRKARVAAGFGGRLG